MFLDASKSLRVPPLKFSPFNALIVPRPIGWVSTISADGVINLAPFSFFNALTYNPPCVMYCPNGRHPDGGPKDSLRNVEATGEFVCNMVSWDLREQMNATSEHSPRTIDEMAVAGLEAEPSAMVKPPRVKAAPAHLECKYLQTVSVPARNPDDPNYMVLGQVLGVHIRDEYIVDGRIDQGAMRLVARLGYMDYTSVDRVFEMIRPD